MSIPGKFYNGVISRQFDAELISDTSSISIRLVDGGDETLPAPTTLSAMTVSSRLHNVPRSLRFPTGQQFLTDDNVAIDKLLESHGLELQSTLAHRLESYQPLVVASLLCVVLSIIGFVKYGIPAVAEYAADFVPESVQVAMGEGVLEQFETNSYFSESQLSEDKRASLRAYFESYLNDENTSILFKDSAIFGANAFALPGGSIVFTDKLVQLSTNDDELLAVYFHEQGHIKHKHLVKQGLQTSLVTLLIISITGDLTAATDLVAIVPGLLLSLSYSRKFETEADQYALKKLDEANIDAVHFANIMRTLIRPSGEPGSPFLSLEYLSTHPAPDERITFIESHSTLPKYIEPK
jgi:Zn-dependent protease with chaperone function